MNLVPRRENCSTMLMRIRQLLEDSRFEFLFGPTDSEWGYVEHSLATFLRDIIGERAVDSLEILTQKETRLPFYERQKSGADFSNVVIVDLSLLSSEILENVTALIGRLIHEFLQRLDGSGNGLRRGEYPVVLVLEEAHNYIQEQRGLEEGSISKSVFERIAREGRVWAWTGRCLTKTQRLSKLFYRNATVS